MREYERTSLLRAEASSGEIAGLIGVGGGERRATPFVGVQGLMLAILEEAIRAYLSPAARCSEEAAQWIGDSRRRWVFSFQVVCETLGLEPSAVRGAVRRMRQRCAPARSFGTSRSRPNSRRHPGLRIAVPYTRSKRRAAWMDRPPTHIAPP